VAFNVGILFVYAMGAMENYMLMNLTCLAIPIIFVLQFTWMPETPQYFLSKDNGAGAAKSLQWLRGKTHDVENELQQLKVSDFRFKSRQFKFTFLQSGQH
jgi:SP family facilitated glucose transporter-like MFS transporter 8